LTRCPAAPTVAVFVLVSALFAASPVLADETPPPVTTPTSTTPEAPPPDPYKAPAPASKPKTSSKPAHVVRSTPVSRTPVRTYAPPVASAPVSAARPVRSHTRKVVHKRKTRVVHKHVAPKSKPLEPVEVTFNPFAKFVAASDFVAISGDADRRDRYLRYAGLAFALLACAGLSLHLQAVRR
jgi:hypothetical protein